VRAPTPEPDVIERITVKQHPQRIIERIVEKPRTPAPQIINRQVCEPAPPPIYKTKVVEVDHSPRQNRETNITDPCSCCCDNNNQQAAAVNSSRNDCGSSSSSSFQKRNYSFKM
jgi:UTP-glucose-1-phosphate uridylyltransferase